MKNCKRILALVGVVVLVLLYVSTLIFALVDDPRSYRMLNASIGATFIIPITIWVIGIFSRLSSSPNSPEDHTENDENNRSDDSEK